MSFASDLALKVSALLARFGMPATLKTVTQTFNKTTGRSTASSTVTLNTTALVKTRKVTSADGRLLVETVAILKIKPRVNDIFTMAGRTWTVLAVEEVQPTDTPVVFFATIA